MTWITSSYSAGNGNCVQWRRSSPYSGGTNCVQWRQSTHCGGGDCVQFRISSHCDTSACVGVAVGELVQVRDSKDPDGPVLTFEPAPWMDFVWGIKNGQFAPP